MLRFFAYDVIRLHQVSGSLNYDDVMTEQVPGVSGANLVGRHLPSVPKYVPRKKTVKPILFFIIKDFLYCIIVKKNK